MKLRLLIVILCCCLASFLNAQDTTTTIKVLDSDYLVASDDGTSWIINGIFQHENATMRCDSTYLDQQANTLEAYGDIFIRQDDTITVKADRLVYEGNTRFARLYDNITLSDGQAVLTTDFLTYDLNTREGNYTQGGQIVNQNDTLISRRGTYFVGSKDAFFREDAIVYTPDATIKSDTLRYNTGTKIAYFYGPTTIEGDDDFIYAENGTYNTGTDQAQFQENAYYQSGHQVLKGDELYYDRQQNFGQARGNVFIIDTVENIILRGELGEYNKQTEVAFVTDSARVLLLTEQDSTGMDTVYVAADTLKTQLVPVPKVREWIAASYQRDVLGEGVPPSRSGGVSGVDTLSGLLPADSGRTRLADSLPAPNVDSLGRDSLRRPVPPDDSLARDSLRASEADTLRGMPAQADSLRGDSLPADVPGEEAVSSPDSLSADSPPLASMPRDTLPADSLPGDSPQADTLPGAEPEAPSYGLIGPPPLQFSDYLPPDVADSLAREMAPVDSLESIPPQPRDESADSARVLFAFNNVRIFKSDMQAISDSLVYTSLDSVMRCYNLPVVWSEGSQMSADFMTIALRNQKIDKLRMYRSAMILSQVDIDSTSYNQMSGKEMTGFFVEGALKQLLVEGNARTIYYVPEDSTAIMGIDYAESSSTLLHFEENELVLVELLKDVDQTTYPVGDPEAITQLEGFHWRENERPRDKEDIFRRVEPSAPAPPPGNTPGSSGRRPGTNSLRPLGAPEPSVPDSSALPLDSAGLPVDSLGLSADSAALPADSLSNPEASSIPSAASPAREDSIEQAVDTLAVPREGLPGGETLKQSNYTTEPPATSSAPATANSRSETAYSNFGVSALRIRSIVEWPGRDG